MKLFIQQFKTFIAKSYSKSFIVLCLIVIGLGVVISLYTVSNLKGGIDAQIAQRQEELNKLLDEKDKQAEAEYQAALQKQEQCLEEYKKTHPWADEFDLSLSYGTGCMQPFEVTFDRTESRYLEDSNYRGLIRIKNTSSFQLFFEKLGFGWWGVIALAAVFVINVLIALIKFLRTTVPMVIGAGSGQVALTKNNIMNMPAFEGISCSLQH